MAYKQIRRFYKSKGGSRPGWCLANTTAGFQIPNKYPSAWEAWKHTEKHAGVPPEGLDVPVYFSYYATIDGIYKNWGHIGVRLKDGRFWSDGVTYPSIASYTNNHAPKYVGWGESVNDYKVIEKDNEMVTITGLNVIYRFLLGQPASDYGKKNYLGKVTFDEAYNKVKGSSSYKRRVAEAKKAKEELNNHLPTAIRKG